MTESAFSFENKSASDIVQTIIAEAIREAASDIHIDPYESSITVRFRRDGCLVEKYTFSKNIHAELIGRLKVLAKLRTDIHTLPQDGRIRLNDHRTFDIRISIIPTYHGENAVLRILNSSIKALTLDEIGMNLQDQAHIRDQLKKRSGLVIVTGPTGSGKTTTLYTLLSLIPKELLIVTIEDPIEYIVPAIRQIQVASSAGLRLYLCVVCGIS
jgi:type II secretory ATPase GspE/PulE/Tfp pilus assembly ATPase PilB-like protein